MIDISYRKPSWEAMSDKRLLEIIGEFIRFNRLNKNISQNQLANDAAISRSTLSLLERGEVVRIDTLIKVLRVLDLLHIMDVFRVEEQISPLEYAKLRKRQRKQASPSRKSTLEDEELPW